MHRKKNLLRLGQRTLTGVPALRVTCYGIADNVVLPLLTANCQKHFVNRIVQIEQADILLQLKLRIRAQRRQVRFRQLRLRDLVEGLDFSPLQAHHVEGDVFNPGNELSVRTQPPFQARSEVPQGKRLRWAIPQIRDRQLLKLTIPDDQAQSFKILSQRCQYPEPVLLVIDLQTLERGEAIVRPVSYTHLTLPTKR